MKTYPDIGVQIPRVYFPRSGIDLTRWAVVACDQFSSQPDYWHKVEEYVGDSPSTLNLILPEVYLDKPGEAERIQSIQSCMRSYLDQGTLQAREGLVYVERHVNGKIKKGIILCLDLECYDFKKDSRSLIRATEGTIVERLPPRMKIREGAALELPHILVLIDDPNRTVIEPLGLVKNNQEQIYDFDLMMASGHLSGYAIDNLVEGKVIESLRNLIRPDVLRSKYGLGLDAPALLFAVGDGNHSLATAKAIWEKMKLRANLDHPARYAMVEIENVHDEGLTFEPIHRVLFGLKKSIFSSMSTHFRENFTYTPVPDFRTMVDWVEKEEEPRQAIGMVVGGKGLWIVEINRPSPNLPVGTLQTFLDVFIKDGGAEGIDYIHGEEVLMELAMRRGNAGFYVPGMKKSDLFKTVILEGVLPRKTFSIGEAKEKRFYMEARKII